MEIIFSKCKDAISHCIATNSYGVFYSDKFTQDNDIHVHDSCEILLCIRGGGSFLIDDNIYEINEGDIYVINQFEPHKMTIDESKCFERYVFQIHPSFLHSHSTEATDLSLCFYTRSEFADNRINLCKQEVNHLLALISKLKIVHSYGEDIIKNNAITEILAYINSKFISGARIEGQPVSKNNKVIHDAVEYINQHYNEDIKLTDIASHCYVSVNHLCSLFKKSLGTTVLKYIISKRISESKKLLKSGKSISETATLCGFGDYANFIRTFKSIVGVSPGKYK